MRPFLHRLPLSTTMLAVVLCAVTGCEEDPDVKRPPINTKLSDFSKEGSKEGSKKDAEKKAAKRDKELNKSPEQVRNDALEKVRDNLAKQEKLAEKALKDGPQSEKKNEKKKDDGRGPKITAMGSAPFTELTFNPKDKHPEKSFSLDGGSKSKSNLAEIGGVGQPSISSSNTINSLANTGASGRGKKNSSAENDAKVMSGRGSAEFGDDVTLGRKEDKPGILSRWFGEPKPETRMLRIGDKGSQIEITNDRMNKKKLGQVYDEKPDGTSFGALSSTNSQKLHDLYNPFGTKEAPNRGSFHPVPADKQGSASERVEGEMARIKLQREAEQRAKNAGNPDALKPALSGKSATARTPVTDFDPAPGAKAPSAAKEPAVANPTASTARGASTAVVGAAGGTAAAAGFNPADSAPITADSPINKEFNPSKFVAPENASKERVAADAAPTEKSSSEPTDAATEAQRQLGTLEAYRKGLVTRDIVAREAAFQRAAAEKRRDAIPALVEEVARNGMLGVMAARVLAIIGTSDEYIDRGLMTGLNTTAGSDTGGLREACAETLGDLRVRRAVPLLIEKAKNEKNFALRAACVAALGSIGDSSAIDTLHMKLVDRNEIEFVKQSAALALARFGDPAGREHLIQSLDSQTPAFQILGLTGLAQLNDPRSPGYMVSALDSRYDEVWTTAVMLFPRLGARSAVPLLRTQMQAGNDVMRMRSALALGYLGCSDGMALICRAARSGSLQERAMGCELLGRLNRTEQIPLLMSLVNDPNTQVRQAAATALARMDAKEAMSIIADAARGRFRNQLIQPVRLNNNEPDPNTRDSRSMLSVQLGSPEDMSERLVMLACLRILRGEKDSLILKSLPSSRDSSWPEFDRDLLKQQLELIKMHKLVDVVPSGAGGTGALIQVPGNDERLFRKGESVAGGFKITDISVGVTDADPQKSIPPYVTLLRGDERVILYVGKSPEVENVRDGVK
ncbi:MAG: HEAT repeat domain-containing protein [Planctomycetota bacterium]